MEKVRNVLIVDAQPGSLIITVKCPSLEILEELWNDYCTGRLNEMVQKFLVTADILMALGLTAVKLTTTILDEDYRACREYFIQRLGEFKGRPLFLLSWGGRGSDNFTGHKIYFCHLWVVYDFLVSIKKKDNTGPGLYNKRSRLFFLPGPSCTKSRSWRRSGLVVSAFDSG